MSTGKLPPQGPSGPSGPHHHRPGSGSLPPKPTAAATSSKPAAPTDQSSVSSGSSRLKGFQPGDDDQDSGQELQAPPGFNHGVKAGNKFVEMV